MTYRAKKQRGVALLLALGFLSLLLVMGIAFVTNATVARKTAANSRARAQARSLAQSAVNRLLAEIRYVLKHPEGGYVAPAELTSAETAGGLFSEENDTSLLQGENSPLACYVYGEKYIPQNIYQDPNLQPKWEFWFNKYDNDGSPASDAAIIGRTAFMALQASGSVNLSEVLRGAPFSPQTGSWSRWNARRGASMRELYLNIDFIKPALYNRFKDERFEDKILGQDAPTAATKADNYPDYDAIFTAAELTDEHDPGATKRNWIQAWLLPGGYNDPEIFAFNSDGTSTMYNDKTVFFHRFNLARRNADDLSVWDSAAGADRVTVDTLLGNPRRFSAKEMHPEPSTALPWLKCMKGDDETYTVEGFRKQIAANLIDYCDEDSVPTSDSTDWGATPPTWTGNEKTPYINEIMISPSISIKRQEITGSTGGETPETTYSYKYSGEIGIRLIAAEVINMYEATFPNLDMAIEGEYTVDVSVDAGMDSEALRNQTITVRFSVPLTGTATDWDKSGRYATQTLYVDGAPAGVTIAPASLWTGFTTAASTTQIAEPLTVTAKVTSLKITSIRLKSAAGDIDYVRDLEFAPDLSSSLTGDAGATSVVTLYPHVGCEVDDPRANLYQGSKTDEKAMNWRVIKVAAVASTETDTPPSEITTGFTFGAKNAFCNPKNFDPISGDQDVEKATEPENVSTAYIKNKPMEALAELGVIHRAEKWRTINLKCCAARIWDADYDPQRSSAQTEGYTYADGDAAILDQVKLTLESFTAGKVNLNHYPDSTANNYLFKALFENIGFGVTQPDHYKPDDVGSRVSSSDAGTLRDALGGPSRTGANKTLLSRGHMVDFLRGQPKFLQGDTDVQKEIIPAASAGLTSTYVSNPDILQFVIVAQSIQDVGTPDEEGVSMTKLKADGSSETLEKVRRGKFDRKGGVYFDEITGEVKLLVTVQINEDTKTVKLLKTEFLD